MRRFLITLLVIVALGNVAQAQTTVNLTVSDTPDNQTWNNGTWAVQLIPGPGSLDQTRNFTLLVAGGSLSSQSGSLSTTGTASFALPANVNIGPSGTKWQFTVCSQQATACSTANITITTNSPQSVTISPPSIRVASQPNLPPILVYTTTEISSAAIGSQITLVGTTPTTPTLQTCTAVSGNTCTTWSSAGGVGTTSSIPGTPGVNAVPVTSGLMAEYRMLPTETCGALVDYSGNSRNATGTAGTAPTIIAGTGGCNFAGTGGIILPTALNTAKTMQVFASINQPNGGVNSPQALVGGNGGGASNNECGFGFLFRVGTNDVGTLVSYGNQSNNLSETFSNANGIALFTYMLDTNDRMFVNATEPGYQNVSTCSGVVPAGPYQLGGSAAGSGFNSATYYTGVEYYAVFYNRVLTAQEIANNTQFITNVMAQRGVTAAFYHTASTNPYVVFQGDSITAGNGTSPAWPSILQNFTGSPNNLSNILVANIGVSGRSFSAAAGIDTNAGLEIAGMLHNKNINQNKALEPNVVILWAGTNNGTTCSGAVCQTLVDDMAVVCKNQLPPSLSTVTYKCGVTTMISRTGEDGLKDGINPLIRAQVPTWGPCCFVVDVAADQRLGADGANASATYFQGDNIHPNQNSAYNIIAPIMSRAVNRALSYSAAGTVLSAQDFSAANVYTVAAPAATATTAGSEATNTVTLTFAANTFLNGQVMTCIGITPAGYNGTWTVLTNSGTQVTYFNPTTGLGAITVQGTCTVPQQIDSDRYIVLNFGAGTFNLQSCLGYTGQNLYIKNINAASSTVASAFASSANRTAELIDGAATATVATGATLILQAVLTSNTAGGCNWVRLQNN